MLAEMSSKELTYWMAFAKLEPFGMQADYYGHGIVASTVANVNRNPKKIKKPFTPADFVPKRKKKEKKQTPEQMLTIAKNITTVLGGQDKRNEQRQ